MNCLCTLCLSAVEDILESPEDNQHRPQPLAPATEVGRLGPLTRL